MMIRRTFLAALILQTALYSKDPVDALNKGKKGMAVKGYDVVAYFAESKPVMGSPQHSFEWMGATWQFASAAHKETFAAEPAKYAPQFGGYCAWAVGHGYTADIDPEAWTILDGKLYLNYSKSVQKKWDQDKEKWVMEAVKNWPTLHK